MSKIEAQPTKKIGTIIKSFADLKPGVLYKLHIHEFDPEEIRHISRVEKFYLIGKKGKLISPEGLVPVEKEDKDGKRETSFYKLGDLGMDIENSSLWESSHSSNELSGLNWVEQVPAEEPTPKNP